MKKILISIVLLIISLNLTACDPVSKKLYGIPFTEPAPPIWTMFTLDESRIKIGEDLTIKFFYSPQSSYGIDTYDPAPISVSAKIIMGHSVYGSLNSYGSYPSELIEEFVLKEIDNFADEDSYPVGASNAAFEEIVIPAEWFVGEKGSIGWSVDVELIWAEETGIEPETQGGGAALYYRVEDENIILYNSYYKFFNDIRNGGKTIFDFQIDLGTIIVALFLISYIIVVVAFPNTKRKITFGVKHVKYFESKEIRKKVHVAASICTIPFIIVHIFLLFINNKWLKVGVTLFLFILIILTWNLVVRFISKDNVKAKKLKEQ